MSNSLEQFIRDHREEFDSEEPSRQTWETFKNRPEPARDRVVKVIRFQYVKWAAAAILLILIGSGTTWLLMRNDSSTKPLANVKPAVQDTPAHSAAVAPAPSNSTQPNETAQTGKSQKSDQPVVDEESTIKEEMMHFARLVEIKHQELKKIQKDEPLLYKQFASDVNKLDSVYHVLEKQLPSNPNHEQLLEAMKQNLQLQMDLLNHQLDIIKQINHSKKSEYENAYKTI